jgi:hypothetical protein
MSNNSKTHDKETLAKVLKQWSSAEQAAKKIWAGLDGSTYFSNDKPYAIIANSYSGGEFDIEIYPEYLINEGVLARATVAWSLNQHSRSDFFVSFPGTSIRETKKLTTFIGALKYAFETFEKNIAVNELD